MTGVVVGAGAAVAESRQPGLGEQDPEREMLSRCPQMNTSVHYCDKSTVSVEGGFHVCEMAAQNALNGQKPLKS